MRRLQKKLLSEARAFGARDLRVVHRRKHPAIAGAAANGRRFLLPFPGSPSDRRSEKNSIAQLRRLLRRHGGAA